MSQVSDGGVPLDRASNIRIFEKLATPHMVDTRRIEALKQFNAVSELPIGRSQRSHGFTIEEDGDSDDSAALSDRGDRDTMEAIIREGIRRSETPSDEDSEAGSISPPRAPSAHDFRSQRGSARSVRSMPSPRMGSTEPPAFAPFARRSSSTRPPEAPPRHPQAPVAPPPLPAPEQDEFSRMVANANADMPSIERMRENYHSRKNGAAYREPSPGFGGASGNKAYLDTFRDLCQSRRMVLEGDHTKNGAYAPHKDPDYAEKRELIIKLDELRSLGFNVARLDISTPIEDLQSELARRTVSQGTVGTVETVIGWLNTAASIIETVNAMAGPFLPMENYAQQVKEGTSTPRFKYACYQLVLRFSGRNQSSPWRIVLMVLLMPLVQGVLIKIIQWLAKGRLPVQASQISSGVKSLFGMSKTDPSEGVPTGIPGISPDMPAPGEAPIFPAAPKSQDPPTSKARVASNTIPNPFAERYPKVHPKASMAHNVPDAQEASPNEPVHRKRRPRLQRPDEISSEVGSEVGGMVVTPAQYEATASA